MPRRPLVALLTSAAVSACATTQAIDARDLGALANGGRGDALVLDAKDGSPVRVGPNTAIRFLTRDGDATAWTSASDLEVAVDGVVVHKNGATTAVAWHEIASAETRNLSGSKSLALVLGSAAVVAVVVALVASDHDSHYGHGSGGFFAGLWFVGVDEPRYYYEERYEGDERPRPVLAMHHDEVQSNLTNPAPLFTGPITRRSTIELVPSVTTHASLASSQGSAFDGARWTESLALTLRLAEMVELGGGVRHTFALRERGADGEGASRQIIGFARVGGHFYLDDEHRFAAPLMVDLGFGSDIAFEARLALGLRVRVYDSLTLGVYPVVPTYTRYENEEAFHGPRWTFPSAVELSLAF